MIKLTDEERAEELLIEYFELMGFPSRFWS